MKFGERRKTVTAMVGGVPIGAAVPVVVQSMTNTDTADAAGTADQVAALARAGSQLVRITVNNEAAAAAVPEIGQRLADMDVVVPLIGDFHYNGHLLLAKYPDCARVLAKYRINPGNVGGKRRDEHFRTIIEIAITHGKPVRIGVNWGSLDQDLLTAMMDANAARPVPDTAHDVYVEAMLESALRSAALAEETGLPHDLIIISAKVSGVQDLVDVYRRLAARCDYPLHLGLTEAGLGTMGVVASTAGLSILLTEGIGFLASAVSFVLWWPQAARVWRHRRDGGRLGGVSITSQVLLVVNAALWGGYAVVTGSFAGFADDRFPVAVEAVG